MLRVRIPFKNRSQQQRQQRQQQRQQRYLQTGTSANNFWLHATVIFFRKQVLTSSSEFESKHDWCINGHWLETAFSFIICQILMSFRALKRNHFDYSRRREKGNKKSTKNLIGIYHNQKPVFISVLRLIYTTTKTSHFSVRLGHLVTKDFYPVYATG